VPGNNDVAWTRPQSTGGNPGGPLAAGGTRLEQALSGCSGPIVGEKGLSVTPQDPARQDKLNHVTMRMPRDDGSIVRVRPGRLDVSQTLKAPVGKPSGVGCPITLPKHGGPYDCARTRPCRLIPGAAR